jgi:non-heme chloroperoxidase
MTRRGHGQSSAPQGGYDARSLALDVASFIEHLGLEKVVLVGHSIAGNEMTVLARERPELLAGLVYLDAAYDRSGTGERVRLDPASGLERPLQPRTLAEYRQRGRQHFGLWNDALEADLRARSVETGGTLIGTDPRPLRAIVAAGEEYRPNYRRLTMPALAVYALFGDLHWLPRVNTEVEPDLVRHFMRGVMVPWQRRSIEHFRREARQGKVIELSGAHHHLFLSHREQIVRETRAFAAAMNGACDK